MTIATQDPDHDYAELLGSPQMTTWARCTPGSSPERRRKAPLDIAYRIRDTPVGTLLLAATRPD